MGREKKKKALRDWRVETNPISQRLPFLFRSSLLLIVVRVCMYVHGTGLHLAICIPKIATLWWLDGLDRLDGLVAVWLLAWPTAHMVWHVFCSLLACHQY